MEPSRAIGDPSSPPSRFGRRALVDDTGQAAVAVVLLAVSMLVVVALALASFGRAGSDRARAQTAADAAALAGVVHGPKAAVELAEANGAVIVSWRRGPGPGTITVEVRVGDAVATARATDGE